jgi:hypothetical protein
MGFVFDSLRIDQDRRPIVKERQNGHEKEAEEGVISGLRTEILNRLLPTISIYQSGQ